MQPAFYEGDMLFLYNTDSPFTVGEIIVFMASNYQYPIAHRIVRIHHNNINGTKFITKGDNNMVFIYYKLYPFLA